MSKKSTESNVAQVRPRDHPPKRPVPRSPERGDEIRAASESDVRHSWQGPLPSGHLDQPYNQSKMGYDLRRLRLHGLIQRIPRKNTYVLTPDGIRVAVFYTKLRNRLLRPLLDADKPPAKTEVRQALRTLENAVANYIHAARLAPAK